jgi:hypothetical protein
MTPEHTDSPLSYYATHGPITDPKEYSRLFAGLPTDIPALCDVIQTITIHYEVGELSGVEPTAQRLMERELRDVPAMLRRILELDRRRLTDPRPPEKRLMINCRDSSTLFCSMLRHHTIPARCRRGFVNYFKGPSAYPDYRGDHWICEYWNDDERRWVMVDAEIDATEQKIYGITIDSLDVAPDDFMSAAHAWKKCRSGEMDADFFGNPDEHGLWFVRCSLVSDLAAVNKMEMLCWDGWGLGDRNPDLEPSAEDLSLLDMVAELLTAGDSSFTGLRSLYEGTAHLKVPMSIKSYRSSGVIIVDL